MRKLVSLTVRFSLAMMLMALASCAQTVACPAPPADLAQAPQRSSGEVAFLAAKADLAKTYVELPSRAGDEAYEAIQSDLWKRRLPRFFGRYQRYHFYKAPIVDQLADGMRMPRTVLEEKVLGSRLISSRRPHDGNSQVAMLFGYSDELLAVAVVGGDCAPVLEDCVWDMGLTIYVPKGTPSRERIELLRTWAVANGLPRERPDRIVELP
ncbi:MAG: hypothetical protein EOP66_00845 [Sphingomonas sp.]|nr:MAG: hypothetical protein EOP66_00845 [Sphingomonas sp.]